MKPEKAGVTKQGPRFEIFSWKYLELLSDNYVKRTVHMQDFGAKSCRTCHNNAPVADILNMIVFDPLLASIIIEKMSFYFRKDS